MTRSLHRHLGSLRALHRAIRTIAHDAEQRCVIGPLDREIADDPASLGAQRELLSALDKWQRARDQRLIDRFLEER